jgi:hypothetical protein
VSDPQTKIQSAPAGAEDRVQQAPIGRSSTGTQVTGSVSQHRRDRNEGYLRSLVCGSGGTGWAKRPHNRTASRLQSPEMPFLCRIVHASPLNPVRGERGAGTRSRDHSRQTCEAVGLSPIPTDSTSDAPTVCQMTGARADRGPGRPSSVTATPWRIRTCAPLPPPSQPRQPWLPLREIRQQGLCA